MTSVINRYYDPTTDEFLSIDPEVATTDQPYVFTNDDPLNETDPSGLKGCGLNPACYVGSAYSKSEQAATRAVDSIENNSVEHDVVDIPQDASYLVYWGSYEAIGKENA